MLLSVTTAVKHSLYKINSSGKNWLWLELERSCDAWICCCTDWFSVFSLLYLAEFTLSYSWAKEERLRLFKAVFLKINGLKHSPWGSCSCWDFSEEFESLAPPPGSKASCWHNRESGGEYPMAGTGRQCSQTHTAIFKGELSYETWVCAAVLNRKHACVFC